MQAILFRTKNDRNGNSRQIMCLSGRYPNPFARSQDHFVVYTQVYSGCAEQAVKELLSRVFPDWKPAYLNDRVGSVYSEMVGPFRIPVSEFKSLKKDCV